MGRRDGIDIVRDRGLTYYFFDDDVAGRPGNHHVISCYSICTGRLTVPMSAAGRPPLFIPVNDKAVSGLGVDLTFHASRITRWTDIKTVALCFLADAVPAFDPRRLPRVTSRRCNALRAAIRREARAPEGRTAS